MTDGKVDKYKFKKILITKLLNMHSIIQYDQFQLTKEPTIIVYRAIIFLYKAIIFVYKTKFLFKISYKACIFLGFTVYIFFKVCLVPNISFLNIYKWLSVVKPKSFLQKSFPDEIKWIGYDGKSS